MTTKRAANPAATTDRPFRGRRMTWQEFWQLRPDRRPANDNPASLAKTHSKNKRDTRGCPFYSGTGP
ncbi:hypothetical protein [Devosia salina]|uniref:Uncharacterized protein n=1 Tax=Devosia salina TaxID=2860336 RepID=A0ABX8W9E6_9HYPH|nr:hypothetical protein [Devosia salina]QYO75326.1 hypothetical protein K1X15_11760 [Devosia salina]